MFFVDAPVRALLLDLDVKYIDAEEIEKRIHEIICDVI